jgi:hypothetical protein
MEASVPEFVPVLGMRVRFIGPNVEAGKYGRGPCTIERIKFDGEGIVAVTLRTSNGAIPGAYCGIKAAVRVGFDEGGARDLFDSEKFQVLTPSCPNCETRYVTEGDYICSYCRYGDTTSSEWSSRLGGLGHLEHYGRCNYCDGNKWDRKGENLCPVKKQIQKYRQLQIEGV